MKEVFFHLPFDFCGGGVTAVSVVFALHVVVSAFDTTISAFRIIIDSASHNLSTPTLISLFGLSRQPLKLVLDGALNALFWKLLLPKLVYFG